MPAIKTAASCLLFVLCAAADAFVLHPAWMRREIAEGQFRRGYFEKFGDEFGLAVDNHVRPSIVPTFLLTAGRELGIPPGITAVAPLAAGAEYVLESGTATAPYIVIGTEAAVDPVAEHPDLQPLPGEARLAGARTLALADGRLALVAWDATLPWREDAARLTALREHCAGQDPAELRVSAVPKGLEIQLGRCSLTEPTAAVSPPLLLLGALAGPEWLTVARRPRWSADEWIEWALLAGIVVKVTALWWALDLAAAVAASAVLGLAAVYVPVPAMLIWPFLLMVSTVAAFVRAGARFLPPHRRATAAIAAAALLLGAILYRATEPSSFPSVMASHEDGRIGACAVVGYSMVKGEGLRREYGGLRRLLDENCVRCRRETAGLFGGGETLDGARDAYCSSPGKFGLDGRVIFLGGINDDFLWGFLSLPRIFVSASQGIESWRQNQAKVAAASLGEIEAQAAAIEGLMQCTRARRAVLLFLHDFLITDLRDGRDPDRAAMLERRRTAVQGRGGQFIDLLEIFGDEAGVSWFNDYARFSLIGHHRVTVLACRIPIETSNHRGRKAGPGICDSAVDGRPSPAHNVGWEREPPLFGPFRPAGALRRLLTKPPLGAATAKQRKSGWHFFLDRMRGPSVVNARAGDGRFEESDPARQAISRRPTAFFPSSTWYASSAPSRGSA